MFRPVSLCDRRAQEESQRRMVVRHNDRLAESQQAFLEWLDLVEERFHKEMMKKQFQQEHPADDWHFALLQAVCKYYSVAVSEINRSKQGITKPKFKTRIRKM